MNLAKWGSYYARNMNAVSNINTFFQLKPCIYDNEKKSIASEFNNLHIHVLGHNDLKSGSYNPLILRYDLSGADRDKLETAKNAARESLFMTIGEAARAYDLLEPLQFESVLGNIVALGMRGSVDNILIKKEKRK